MPSKPVKSAAKTANKSEFETSTGLKIQISAVDPMFMQTVVNSVPLPKAPTYEVTTMSGRVEVHRMDAIAAKQLENGESIWQAYLEERTYAQNEQNQRVMKAIFLMGTQCEIPEGNWEKKWRFLNIPIPTDEEEKRAFYLTAELPAADQVALMSAIMRLAGVDENIVKQAEDTFRSEVREGDE